MRGNGKHRPDHCLPPEKLEKLRLCEVVLEQTSPLHRGRALLEIRDDGLYLAYRTFENYCRKRWGISRFYAYRLIGMAVVVNNLVNYLLPIGNKTELLPVYEAQTRPLVYLDADQQRQAWSRAVEMASGGNPTAKQVEAAVREISPRSSFDGPGIPTEKTSPPDVTTWFARIDKFIGRLFSCFPVRMHTTLIDYLRRAIDRFDVPQTPSLSVVEIVPQGVNGFESNGVATNGVDHPIHRADVQSTLTYGSVCSGIEAASVAWHSLGWRPAWFAEIDPFASAVLAHHYPDVENHGDFTAIRPEPGSIDLLVGGTPCQSFSVNGLRKGLDDDRGNLALGFLRLAGRARPLWIVWENVPGVLSSWSDDPDCPPRDVDRTRPGDGRAQVVQQRHDFGCFLEGLSQLGYGWAYRVLDAQYVGGCDLHGDPFGWGPVPQRRRRVFVVGYLGGGGPAAAVLIERSCLSKPRREGGEGGERFSLCAEGPTRHIGSRNGNGFHDGYGHSKGRIRGPIFGVTGDASPKFGVGITPTLRASQGGEGVCVVASGIRSRLTPLEWERLQGFPDNYTRIPFGGKDAEECPDGLRCRAVGNSMAIPVMHRIGLRIQEVAAIMRRDSITEENDNVPAFRG